MKKMLSQEQSKQFENQYLSTIWKWTHDKRNIRYNNYKCSFGVIIDEKFKEMIQNINKKQKAETL